MKVFLTGGTGFIGAHIVRELVSRGDYATILTRDARRVPAFQEIPGLSVLEGSLDDLQNIRDSMEGHDACIHNALLWDETPTELELRDLRAAVGVFRAASEVGIQHLVYTSSTAVHRPFHAQMTEADRLVPADSYGATKAAAEAFFSAFSHTTPMRCNVIRPGPTVGKPAFERAGFTSDRRIREIVRCAVAGEEIRVEAGGRQFIGVRDLATLYASVLHSDANRETYVAVSRELTTWEEIARLAVEMAGSRSPVIVAGQAERASFDTGKLERDFGYVFDADIELRELLEHLVGQT